ncbi:MAG: hypothetical protein ACREP8_11990 [Candidatus Binatia bacterium]
MRSFATSGLLSSLVGFGRVSEGLRYHPPVQNFIQVEAAEPRG